MQSMERLLAHMASAIQQASRFHNGPNLTDHELMSRHSAPRWTELQMMAQRDCNATITKLHRM